MCLLLFLDHSLKTSSSSITTGTSLWDMEYCSGDHVSLPCLAQLQLETAGMVVRQCIRCGWLCTCLALQKYLHLLKEEAEQQLTFIALLIHLAKNTEDLDSPGFMFS